MNYGVDSIQQTRAEELARSFMGHVYTWMCFGLAMTGGVSWYVCNSEAWMMRLFGDGMGIFFGLVIAELALVVYLSARITKLSPTAASALFALYAALNGVTLAPIFLVYTSESIASTFFITAGTFGAMSMYGYATKRDLSGVGSFAMMGLIGVIIASVVNIFLRSPMVVWVTSVIAVLVFVLLTAYDTQKIKQMAYGLAEDDNVRGSVAVLGALSLYLDFVNLFIHLLMLFGKKK